MKNLLLVFLGFFIAFNMAYPVAATEGIVIKTDYGVKKIYRIGSNNVSYSSINPDKIQYIGSKRVEYNLSGDIVRIGDDQVVSSVSGYMIKVGDKKVVYSGKKISSIGNDTVFYK